MTPQYFGALVSIQPKPKKGLVEIDVLGKHLYDCFNPAEAEEGFSSKEKPLSINIFVSFNPAEAEEGFSSGFAIARRIIVQKVSIQPKPKKGLVAE